MDNIWTYILVFGVGAGLILLCIGVYTSGVFNGKCQYCGETCGFLQKSHQECEEKYNLGWQNMVRLVYETIFNGANQAELINNLNQIASKNLQKPENVRSSIIQGTSSAVTKVINDGIITVDDETRIASFINKFKLTQDELEKCGRTTTRLVQAAILREVYAGKIPSRVNVVDNMPFNFQKGEILVWAFPLTSYYEYKTRSHYEGGSAGMSVRVAKGVTLRQSSYRGHKVETTALEKVDIGWMAFSNKHIYFSGMLSKKFRVRYDKIIEITSYSDGIEIQKDSVTQKPQVFTVEDGEFAYRLAWGLAKLFNASL